MMELELYSIISKLAIFFVVFVFVNVLDFLKRKLMRYSLRSTIKGQKMQPVINQRNEK